ncbi:MAG: leucyl/phenylalanyl-tRNA--protein transferase [Acidimicrobiales bacterium]
MILGAAAAHLAELGLPPCRWEFPSATTADPSGLVVVGGDLAPETLVTAYCSGLFPMPVGRKRRLGWWSPDPRGVLPLPRLRVSRSLRRSLRRFEIRIDTSFVEVMRRCGDPRRPHGWITEGFVDAYERLHHLGLAHSVETWSDDGELVGGLYGVSIGGLFAGESMFHTAPDASKVALVALAEVLEQAPGAVLDVQWLTPHLASLGAVEISRRDYLDALPGALALPAPVFALTRGAGGAGSAKS